MGSPLDELEDAPAQGSPLDELDDAPAPAQPPPPPRPATAAPKDGAIESAQDFGRGAVQGATFNFGDEISGRIAQGLEYVAGPSNPDLPTSAYETVRNQERGADKVAEKRSPFLNTLGQVTGGALVPGGPAMAGSKLAVRAGVGIAKTAAEGALSAAGASEAEDARGITRDAVTGANTAVATAAPLAMGGKLLGKAASGIAKQAPRLAKNALIQRVLATGLDPNNVNDMGGVTVEQQAARQAKMGIGGGLKSTATIQEEAAAKAAELKTRRATLAAAFDKAGVKPDPQRIAQALKQEAKLKAGPVGRRSVEDTQGYMVDRPVIDPDKKPLVKALQERGEYFRSLPEQRFSAMDDMRAGYGERAKFGKDTPEAAVRQDVHKAINDELERSIGPSGAEFREIGQDQAAAINITDAAERAQVKGQKRPFMQGGVFESMGRAISPSLRAEVGERASRAASKAGPIGRALSAHSSRVARLAGRGAATGVTKVQNAARESEEEAAKAHFLESQTNPEYRAYTTDKDEEE